MRRISLHFRGNFISKKTLEICILKIRVQILFYRYFRCQLDAEKRTSHILRLSILNNFSAGFQHLSFGVFCFSPPQKPLSPFFFLFCLEAMVLWRGRLTEKSLISLCYHLQYASAGSESTRQRERQLAALRALCQKSTARQTWGFGCECHVQALLWQSCWCSPALRWTRSQLTGILSFTLHSDSCHFLVSVFIFKLLRLFFSYITLSWDKSTLNH